MKTRDSQGIPSMFLANADGLRPSAGGTAEVKQGEAEELEAAIFKVVVA